MSELDAILSVEKLTVRFGGSGGGVEAVRGASFAVPRGKMLALVGKSGAGKSVVAQAILQLLRPTARVGGDIRFRGSAGEVVDIAGLGAGDAALRRLRGGKIGLVFQDPAAALSPVHTIGNQLLEVIYLHRTREKKEARAIAIDMLGKVGLTEPERRMRQYAFELSGGMRQRAAIGIALAGRPELLIADEPTTALDATLQSHILALLKGLKEELGLSVLFITHDFGVVERVADEIAVMEEGVIVEAGEAGRLLGAPVHAVTRELVGAAAGFEPVGGGAARGPRNDAGERPLLQVKNLVKHFRERRRLLARSPREVVRAVDGISFDVYRGETLGILGESGSGKTTAVRCILRAMRPTAGEVLFDNGGEVVDLARVLNRGLKPLRRQMQMVFQDPFSSLNPRMTVEHLLTEPLLIHGMGTRASRAEAAAEILERVGLSGEVMQRYPHAFSGGQRQRLAIARALILKPALIVADEAVSSLDVTVQAQILELLRELKRTLGLTCIFVAHNLAVVRAICDRVAVMREGKIVEIGTCEQVFSEPRHDYTRVLLSSARWGMRGKTQDVGETTTTTWTRRHEDTKTHEGF